MIMSRLPESAATFVMPHSKANEAETPNKKEPKTIATEKTTKSNPVKRCRKYLQQEKTNQSIAKECENIKSVYQTLPESENVS